MNAPLDHRRTNARGKCNGRRPSMSRATRKRIEAAVESLLALLDELDGDADFEPSLGAAEHHKPFSVRDGDWWRLLQPDQRLWGRSANDDREQGDDDEPSLGWTVRGRVGGMDDLEAEHDGREPEAL